MFMQAVVKVLIGIVLVVGSVWWIWQGADQYLKGITINHKGIADLVTVLDGAVPVLVFLLGIFIVWLEIDEMKIEKELKKRK
jgi:uncharacterized membrane protein YwzB